MELRKASIIVFGTCVALSAGYAAARIMLGLGWDEWAGTAAVVTFAATVLFVDRY